MKFNILDCHSYDKIIKRKSYDIMDFRIDPQSYKLKDIVHAFLKDKPSIFKIQSVVYDEYGIPYISNYRFQGKCFDVRRFVHLNTDQISVRVIRNS